MKLDSQYFVPFPSNIHSSQSTPPPHLMLARHVPKLQSFTLTLVSRYPCLFQSCVRSSHILPNVNTIFGRLVHVTGWLPMAVIVHLVVFIDAIALTWERGKTMGIVCMYLLEILLVLTIGPDSTCSHG